MKSVPVHEAVGNRPSLPGCILTTDLGQEDSGSCIESETGGENGAVSVFANIEQWNLGLLTK